jgi:hypothetical protein
MVIVVWCLVALFWGCIIGKHFYMKDEQRAERARKTNDAVVRAVVQVVFNCVNWVRTRIFRRPSLKFSENPAMVVDWLASKGIRSHAQRDEQGKVEIFIHDDDKDKLAAVFSEYGFEPPAYTGETPFPRLFQSKS